MSQGLGIGYISALESLEISIASAHVNGAFQVFLSRNQLPGFYLFRNLKQHRRTELTFNPSQKRDLFFSPPKEAGKPAELQGEKSISACLWLKETSVPKSPLLGRTGTVRYLDDQSNKWFHMFLRSYPTYRRDLPTWLPAKQKDDSGWSSK